jgi:hypothetical protein
MSEKDFDKAMKILEFADVAEYYPFRWVSECQSFDRNVKDLSPDEEALVKKRMIECRENLLWSDREFIQRWRKVEKIPKSRFRWWLDEL